MFTKQKRCRYCKGLFRPDPRVKDQQIACGKPSCRKARKSEAHKRWVEKNPNCFKGRYSNIQDWLEEHPGYLKAYRESHPEYVERNRIKQKQRREKQKRTAVTVPANDKEGVDIQDTIISQPVVKQRDSSILVSVDIQDTISAQLVVPVHVKSILPHVDIQDEIDRILSRGYTWTRIAREVSLNPMQEGRCLKCIANG